MPLSRRVVICASLLAAGSAACNRQAAKEAEVEPPVLVMAEPVQIGDIHGVVSATGIVVALPGADFVAIAPQPARVVDVFKKAGDHVKSGELMVRFEFPSLRAEDAARAAAVKAAELRLQSAKLVQSRVHGLVERGAASRKEVEDADRDVNDAETAATEARADQNASAAAGQQNTIRAPFEGLVSERLHNPGDFVGNSANDVILRLVDPRQVEVNATVPVKDVTRFAIGATARAVGKTNPDLMRVMSRPEPEPGATTVNIRLAFEQPTELATGTQVGVEIDAEQHANVLLVPAITVVKDGNNDVVFVAAGDRAIKRTVVTGLVDAEHVEIRSGVKAGELVITQGQSNLQDGAAIGLNSPDAPGSVYK